MIAHPFGDPQTVEVARGADPAVVEVTWKVGAADDLTLLGIELGVLPEDRLMLDGAISFEDGDPEAVAASEEFRDYLLERIGVASGGADCEGDVVEVDDLTDGAAHLEFTCPGPVSTAAVTVRTLTDLHPAYRTLASGPAGQRAVYESQAETHEWSLGSGAPTADATIAEQQQVADSDVGRSAALQMGAVGGAVLLILLVAAVLRRRLRTHNSTT